jgi:hypothetical protein
VFSRNFCLDRDGFQNVGGYELYIDVYCCRWLILVSIPTEGNSSHRSPSLQRWMLTYQTLSVLPPNRIEPLWTEPGLGFSSISLRSVRFDDNPNHEIRNRFDSVVRDRRFDSIRIRRPRLEPNRLLNRFDLFGSVCCWLYSQTLATHVKYIPRFVTDFHAFRAFKTSKFCYILEWRWFGMRERDYSQTERGKNTVRARL